MNLENIIDDIVEKRKKFLQSKIKRYPANVFRASDITDCDRYMVYSILNWQDRKLHDEGLQAIFERGNKEEREVKKDLSDIGYEIIESQMPGEIKNRAGEVICRYHIDGKFNLNGEGLPVEIKSCNMNTWNAIKNLDSLQKKPLHRKYLRQMQVYLFGNDKEKGIIIFTDLQGHYKLLPVYLDLGECEWILQRLERNWDYVKKKDYPKGVEWEKGICEKCAFVHVCLPSIINKPANIIDSPELEEKLERHTELEPLVDEWEELDKEIKKPYKDADEALVTLVGSNWQIYSKKTKSQKWRKDTPGDIKKKWQEEYTKTQFVKIIDLREEKK